jgi:hypothetical protein
MDRENFKFYMKFKIFSQCKVYCVKFPLMNPISSSFKLRIIICATMIFLAACDSVTGRFRDERAQERTPTSTVENLIQVAPPEKLKEEIVESGFMTSSIYFNPFIEDDLENCKESNKSILDAKGKEILKVCPKTFNDCSMQGSCTVKSRGQIYRLNIYDRIDGVDRFFIIPEDSCEFGFGVENLCLVPYKSLAADLKIYRPGDVIYIPAFEGLDMGNGVLHDGFFVIKDKGRGIVGRGRFDFFTGNESWRNEKNPFVKLKIHDPDTRLTYFKMRQSKPLKPFNN